MLCSDYTCALCFGVLYKCLFAMLFITLFDNFENEMMRVTEISLLYHCRLLSWPLDFIFPLVAPCDVCMHNVHVCMYK